MPELPEVETVRRGLEAAVTGRRVAQVQVSGRRSVRRQSPAAFVAALEGRSLVRAGRHGKYLLIGLDDGATLVVHLRMSGQLLLAASEEASPPHTHVRLLFDGFTELRFVDPRTFGELFVAGEHDERGRPVELALLGPDPLVERLDEPQLRRLLAGRRAPIKALLLDQHVIAGIGNIYADEILHRARIRPDRPAGTLGPTALGRLASAISEILTEAVELRGSSLRDARYRDLMGEPGDYQAHHAVYDRAGKPCPTCGRPVERLRLRGRSAHFCRRCQR